MHKTLTAGLTALSLILIPAAPVQAQNNNNDANKIILGLLAAGAIGLAIKNNRSDDKPNVTIRTTPRHQQAHQPQGHAHNQQNAHNNRLTERRQSARRHRAVDPIPGRCFRRVETARGGYQTVYTKRCLDRRYRDAHTLPRQCVVRIGGRNGNRRGYDASCLRDFGYRSDRRWD